MNILMRFLFNLRHVRKANGESVVAVVLDGQAGVERDELVRLLQVWQDRLTVDAVLVRPAPLESGTLGREVSSTCRTVGVVSERTAFIDSVQRECQAAGLVCTDSAYPHPASARELALSQEVAHHDFEIGGVNEWDEQPTKYSRYILQHLSRTHCERIFPHFLLPYIRQFQEQDKTPVEALDIGCGPISVLRWGVLQGLLHVTAVDPLLDMYRIILERHGLAALPAISCQRELNIRGEEITTVLAPEAFDIIFTRNAIDHAEDPVALVRQAGACLRSRGILVLDFNTREGSRQNWKSLHQFDLYLDEQEQPACQSRDGLIRPLVPQDTGLFLREIVVHNTDTTVVILEKDEGYATHEQQRQSAAEWRTQQNRARREQAGLYDSSAFAYFRRFKHALHRWFQ